MLHHELFVDVPHSAARIWALLHDHECWTEWPEMVDRVDVLRPGDGEHRPDLDD